MKRIKFPLVKKTDSNLIDYPDDVSLFSNTITVDNIIHADYTGDLDLEESIKTSGIREITKRAFMKRIDQLDRIAIRKSTDDIVIDIHEDLKMASSVDLDDEDVTNSIAYLASKNLLANTDMTALVADGTIEESI